MKQIDATDWYIAREIRKHNVEVRGREATAMQYVLAAIQQANEENLTVDQLISFIHQANGYIPKKMDAQDALKKLGF